MASSTSFLASIEKKTWSSNEEKVKEKLQEIRSMLNREKNYYNDLLRKKKSEYTQLRNNFERSQEIVDFEKEQNKVLKQQEELLMKELTTLRCSSEGLLEAQKIHAHMLLRLRNEEIELGNRINSLASKQIYKANQLEEQFFCKREDCQEIEDTLREVELKRKNLATESQDCITLLQDMRKNASESTALLRTKVEINRELNEANQKMSSPYKQQDYKKFLKYFFLQKLIETYLRSSIKGLTLQVYEEERSHQALREITGAKNNEEIPQKIMEGKANLLELKEKIVKAEDKLEHMRREYHETIHRATELTQ